MSTKKQGVGSEIETRCTKCKIDRLHVIETMKADGNINRVICRSCGSRHLFRAPKGAATKARTTSRSPGRRKAGAVKVAAEDVGKAKPYALDGRFEVGDIIQHTKFGTGKVLVVKHGKMEVGFEGGGKLLVCRPR